MQERSSTHSMHLTAASAAAGAARQGCGCRLAAAGAGRLRTLDNHHAVGAEGLDHAAAKGVRVVPVHACRAAGGCALMGKGATVLEQALHSQLRL